MVKLDREALKRRRELAARLFEQEASQADVARRTGVSRQAASVWWRIFKTHGAQALRAPGEPGRPARLTASQHRALQDALLAGPVAHGFPTDLWTLPRIAVLIRRQTGVRYHPGHVWKILRQLGWSLQRPTTRAREQDEAAVARWRSETWPALKKTPPGAARRSSSSTKAASPSGPRSGARGRRAAARRS
jgi:transposase